MIFLTFKFHLYQSELKYDNVVDVIRMFQLIPIPSNNEEIVDGNCVMCVLLDIHIIYFFYFFLNCWLFTCPHVRLLEGGEYKKAKLESYYETSQQFFRLKKKM
jgi:hypothetical protein